MANRSDRVGSASRRTMRRMDRRLLSGLVTRGIVQPGEPEAAVRKLLIEASVHASNIRSKASTMLTNVDKAGEEESA